MTELPGMWEESDFTGGETDWVEPPDDRETVEEFANRVDAMKEEWINDDR